jgi:integration host factor subunit beta
MNKSNLINKIQNYKTLKLKEKTEDESAVYHTYNWQSVLKLPKKAPQVVDIFFDTIKEALLKGERVEIRGLGVFELRLRKARMGRNPKTEEVVSVPAKIVPFFKPSQNIKRLLNTERKI